MDIQVVDRAGRVYAVVMRHSLHLRSRIFRSLLALALLAWTALAFNAFAQPLAMTESDAAATHMAMGGKAGTHCDGMAGQASPNFHPALSHPTGNGHGCCQNSHCYCASFCNGIVGVPYIDMAWVPPHATVLVPVHVAPALAQNAPPLRPPIV